MSRLSRSVRIAVAGLLAVSAVIIFGASPASAATGSLVDDGNGGLVVTYSSPTGPGDTVALLIFPSGSSCSDVGDPDAVLSNDPNAPQLAQIAESPVTIVAGTTALGIQSQGAYTLAATSYTFCLVLQSELPTPPLAQLTMTLGAGAPTTTSTTTAPSTTTTAAADPVAPAFTG